MTKRHFFAIIFLLIFGFTISYIRGFVALIWFITSIFIYSFVFYGFYYLWKKLRGKYSDPYKLYLPYFIEKISGSLFLLIIIIGSFSYYNNDINPSKMPIYNISNGDKQVIFQSMSHIGTKDFYDKVKENIRKNKKRGYVLFFEGVKPGKKENHDKFNEAIGIKFGKDLYENFSKLYGLVNQKNEDFLFLVNNLDFNIDLSIDEIISYYEDKKVKTPKTFIQKNTKKPIDVSSEVMKLLSELNDEELKILIYLNQGIINFIIKNDSFRNFIVSRIGNQDLFDIILNKRNEVLADSIISSKYKKIIITYGLMHFEGVLELLKKNDPKWEIQSIDYLYPIG